MSPAMPCLVAAGTALPADTEALAAEPDFRKATAPMLLAYRAIERALAALPDRAKADLSDWGLIVGVSHGELEVTKDFLVTLTSRGLARPFLFQSALHNATLGFLSIRFGIRGPGATTSTHHFAGEDALTLAADLVASGACEACLCVGVEAIDPEMRPAVQAVYDDRATPGSDAGAVVLTSAAFAKAHGLAATHELRAVACERAPDGDRAQRTPPLSGYHGAGAVAQLALALAAEAGDVELTLAKPDGSRSRLSAGRRR